MRLAFVFWASVNFSVSKFVAGGLGFEPRRTAPKTVVLPLDDPPTVKIIHVGGRTLERNGSIDRTPICTPGGALGRKELGCFLGLVTGEFGLSHGILRR